MGCLSPPPAAAGGPAVTPEGAIGGKGGRRPSYPGRRIYVRPPSAAIKHNNLLESGYTWKIIHGMAAGFTQQRLVLFTRVIT